MVSYLEEDNKIQFYEVFILSIITYCFCFILKKKKIRSNPTSTSTSDTTTRHQEWKLRFFQEGEWTHSAFYWAFSSYIWCEWCVTEHLKNTNKHPTQQFCSSFELSKIIPGWDRTFLHTQALQIIWKDAICLNKHKHGLYQTKSHFSPKPTKIILYIKFYMFLWAYFLTSSEFGLVTSVTHWSDRARLCALTEN